MHSNYLLFFIYIWSNIIVCLNLNYNNKKYYENTKISLQSKFKFFASMIINVGKNLFIWDLFENDK